MRKFPHIKLLIVEDDRDFLNDLVIFLNTNFLVSSATNSLQGLNMYQITEPECCIIDINLPHYFHTYDEYEGLALAKKIKQSRKKEPSFIFISQKTLPISQIDLSNYTYIQKPFKVEELLEAISEYTKHSKGKNGQ